MIEITGLDKAINKMDRMANLLRPNTLIGMDRAGHDLVRIIRDRTMRDNPKYANSVTCRTNWGQEYSIIGPTLEHAPLEEMGAVSRYVHYKCPWWKYVGGKLRARIVSEPRLRSIVNENLGRYKNLIVQYLNSWIRSL